MRRSVKGESSGLRTVNSRAGGPEYEPVSKGELLVELRRQLGEGERLFKRLEALREYAKETTQQVRDAGGLERLSEKSLHRLIRTVENTGLNGGRPRKHERRKSA